jgi:hypothetical protein
MTTKDFLPRGILNPTPESRWEEVLSQWIPFHTELLGWNKEEIIVWSQQFQDGIEERGGDPWFWNDSLLRRPIESMISSIRSEKVGYTRPLSSALESAVCNGKSHDLSTYTKEDWQNIRDRSEGILQIFGQSLKYVAKREINISPASKIPPLAYQVREFNIGESRLPTLYNIDKPSLFLYDLPWDYSLITDRAGIQWLRRPNDLNGLRKGSMTISYISGSDTVPILFGFSENPHFTPAIQWFGPFLIRLKQGIGMIHFMLRKNSSGFDEIHFILPQKNFILYIHVEMFHKSSLALYEKFFVEFIVNEYHLDTLNNNDINMINFDYFDFSNYFIDHSHCLPFHEICKKLSSFEFR